MSRELKRCVWCGCDPLYIAYHDREWGVPVYDDLTLFEFLLLEGAQAGLSWITILKRRQGYREVFDSFDPEKIARYQEKKISALLANPAIIRNRLKVRSAISNARAFLKVQEEFESFAEYQWRFVEGKPIQNRWKTPSELPSQTKQSDLFSKDLKKRGFSFVGSTIIYAYMQAVGMVNDHTTDCFRHAQLLKSGRSFAGSGYR
ncbi:MAG: DNA-3-methyladenine glycosylase I [Deltaproteobacteria bacterium]|nr:DNA-3-methyladenine glycosylase I [Deltaproteobacteria bacterium]